MARVALGKEPGWGGPPPDPARLGDRAERLGMGPLLARHAEGIGLSLSAGLRRRAEGAYLETLGRNVFLLDRVREACRRLSEGGIPVLLFKGVATGERYFGDPGLRPMEDADFWVPERLKGVALRRLEGLGFREGGGGPPGSPSVELVLAEPPGAKIDLHTAVGSPGRFALDLGRIWSRSRPAGPEWGGTTRVPPPEDEAALLAVHLARHLFDLRLVQVMDFAFVVERAGDSIRWGRLRDRARREGFRVGLETALALIDRWFGIRPGTKCAPSGSLWRRGLVGVLYDWRSLTPLRLRSRLLARGVATGLFLDVGPAPLVREGLSRLRALAAGGG